MRRHPVAVIATTAVVAVAVVGVFAWRGFAGARHADVERLVSETRLSLVQGEVREASATIERALAADPDHLDAAGVTVEPRTAASLDDLFDRHGGRGGARRRIPVALPRHHDLVPVDEGDAAAAA